MPPERYSDPSDHVVKAALRGLHSHSADALISRLPATADRNPFQQRVAEELERLDLTRLLWVRCATITDVEIFRRKHWDRLRPREARDLLLDRYRQVGLHNEVEAWIINHIDTPEGPHE